MATSGPSTAARASQAELDATMNRIQLKMAGIESMVKSWTSQSKCDDIEEHRKTDAEIDAEDAIYFRPQPPYLGVGCPIPENYMVSEADRSKKTLEAKFGRGLQASKRRNAEEKAESAKRALRDDSSDEEGGRSSLGKQKKKKLKTAAVPEQATPDIHTPVKVVGGNEKTSKVVKMSELVKSITSASSPTPSIIEEKKRNKPESSAAPGTAKEDQETIQANNINEKKKPKTANEGLVRQDEEVKVDTEDKKGITKVSETFNEPLPIRSKKMSQKKRAKLRKLLALAQTG